MVFLRKAVHYRNSRFKDRNNLETTAKYLGISNPFSYTLQQCIYKLKEVKLFYKTLEMSHQSMRDNYVQREEENKTLLMLRKRERDKNK